MASATWSDAITTLALALVSLLVLILLNYFLPLRTAPSYLSVPTFLALALPATIILLVPIDLASSARIGSEPPEGVWLSKRVVLVGWRISYWLTFVLTWFILPFLGEYMDSGFRDPKHRITYSLRSNGRYQLIVLGCALAGFTYISVSYGFNFTAIKGLIMALAYVWGLILAIYLMGHGLVAVPRRMFRNANMSGKLYSLQRHAPRVREKLDDAILNLEELEGQIGALKQRKSGTTQSYREWIDELAEITGLPEARAMISPTARDAAAQVPAVVTERYLADVTRRLDRARRRRDHCIEEWDTLVRTASDIQTILDSKASKHLTFGRSLPNGSLLSRYSPLTPYLRYHLYMHLVPGCSIVLGTIFALASLSIVWSELVKFPIPQASAISITVIHQPNNESYQIGFGGQLMAAAWIFYMCACALTSVNDMPVWNQRALVKSHTSAESACWYASQIAKLTVPLSYNFLTMLPPHIHRSTTFYHFLGRLVNLTPLGTWFDYIFPVMILLPVCATYFNLYGRIKKIFGFGILEMGDDDDRDSEGGGSASGIGGWREGRDLIRRDLAGHHSANPTSLGLLDSSHPSSDSRRPIHAANRAPSTPNPTNPPAVDHSLSITQQPSRSQRNQRPSRPEQRQGIDLDPEPEEENIFTLFGKKVKNTIDTIDTPRWMQPRSSSSPSRHDSSPLFKTPRWMENTGDGSSGSGSGSGLRRLFGTAGSTNDTANTNTNTNNNNGSNLWL